MRAGMGWMRTVSLLVVMLVGTRAAGYLSSAPTQPVPEHIRAWEETTETDPRTALLWKFSTEADAADDLDAFLEDGDLLAMPTRVPTLEPAQDAGQPRLEGDAQLGTGRGRFGGGLVLGGHGYAQGSVGLSGMLASEHGFTLDFWFQPEALPEAGATALLARVAGGRRDALLALRLTADGTVELVADGEVRMAVPLRTGPGVWHHLTLVWEPRALTLMVDDRLERIPASNVWVREEHSLSRELFLLPPSPVPAWLTALPRQVDRGLWIGGAPGVAGFRGVIDEVRVSRGVRFFYRHHLGMQEGVDLPRPPEPAAPYFRGSGLLARLRFDGTLTGEGSENVTVSGDDAAAQYRSGIRGQALDLSRIGAAQVAWDGIDWPPGRNGSIEFWFRPLDWHNFYRGEYHGGDLPSPLTLMRLRNDAGVSRPIEVHRGTAGSNAKLPWFRIHPGAWTHVLIVFENRGQTKYINGRQTRLDQVWLFPRSGEGPWSLRMVQSNTLIDELSVYPWAMNATEAWNAYARWLPDAEAQMRELPRFEVDFIYIAHSWNMQERLRIGVKCMEVDGVQPTHVDVVLRAEDGEILLEQEGAELDGAGSATLTLARALPFGRYPVAVRSRSAEGAVVAETTLDYNRERPAWYENTLGLDGTVPVPWEPMTVDGRTVRLWGRALELGEDGLPERITALEREVLAAPMRIRLTGADGVQTSLAGRGVRVESAEPDRVAWRAVAQSGDVLAGIQASMEFDGLLYCSVLLRPSREAEGGRVRVDALHVEVPMTAAHTGQLIANGGGNDFRRSWVARQIPSGEGSVWNSRAQPWQGFTRAIGLENYMPHIWLGDDMTGLYFGGENDRGWTVGGEQPAQEIVREQDAVLFRMNIIREPIEIGPEGHAFHFVLLPTPAKAEPENWRHAVTQGGYGFSSMDTFAGFDMKTDPADPQSGDAFRLEPRSWEHAGRMAEALREKSGQSILYADASWPVPGPSFADWNHDMFAGTGRFAWTPEFEDYVVWVVNEYLERDLIDGIYFDDVSVGHTFSLAATAYPFEGPEQGRRIGFTHLAQRRVLMRLWRLFLAHGKNPGISVHMTYCYEVPIFSFCQYIYNAEIFSGVKYPGNHDAMDEWPGERVRLLAGAAKWGAGHPFISTLPRTFDGTDAAWRYRQIRTEDAVFMTGDVPGAASPWYMEPGLAQVVSREGVFAKGVRGYPFWLSGEVLALAGPDGATLHASVFAHADRAFVFVANRDREAHEVVLGLKPDGLFAGARGLVWRDVDPGLKPPAQTVASTEEIHAVAQAGGGLDMLEAQSVFGGMDLDDLLAGSTPEERALEALALRTEGNRARVIVRPRDYRVLEVRPQ